MSTGEFFQLFLYLSNWDTTLNLLFISLSLIYLFLTASRNDVYGWQKVVFILSLSLYYFALGSPLNLVAHDLFSMHMLQMSILYFIVPPLLLIGLPAIFFKLVSKVGFLAQIGRFFSKPLLSLFFFNGTISLYHIPVVFDAIMSSKLLHIVSHSMLMFAALCMWWPILGDKNNKLKPLYRIGLIFANGVLLTPACAMITFTENILYETYAKMSPFVPILSPLHDQQLGGVIMKICQEIVYICAIGMVFFQWVREERKRDEEELRAG